MSVSDPDVADEYRRRNEKIKLDVVPLTPEAFRSQVTVSDADLTAHFDKNKEMYRIGEKRKVRYALVDVDQVRQQVTVPEPDIEAFYKQNQTQYSTPEQIRASHILLKTDGKDEVAVRKQAEDLLQKVKSGADFAALAKQFSEDEVSGAKGGDLDYFGRGAMVPEFEQAAFAMKTGDISDLVKTSFGFHIIKVVDKREAATRPLAEVRTEIEDQLKWQKAQQQAEQTAKTVAAQLKTAADLDRVAKERGFHVQDTGLFLREDPIDGLGPSPEVAGQAFQLADGAVSPALRVSRGWVFITVTQKQDAYVPQLAEVTTRVRDDLIRQRAGELAKAKGAEIAAMLKGAGDFAAAVKKAGLEVKPTELIARGAPIPDIGVSPEIDKVVFPMPVGTVSDPISTPQGTAIVRVAEKESVTEAQIAAGMDQTREEVLNQRRDRFFGGYMTKAKEGLKIAINQETLARAVGPAPAGGAPMLPPGATR
jgi:peptidyl-prolyl cis-trans isomerase D